METQILSDLITMKNNSLPKTIREYAEQAELVITKVRQLVKMKDKDFDAMFHNRTESQIAAYIINFPMSSKTLERLLIIKRFVEPGSDDKKNRFFEDIEKGKLTITTAYKRLVTFKKIHGITNKKHKSSKIERVKRKYTKKSNSIGDFAINNTPAEIKVITSYPPLLSEEQLLSEAIEKRDTKNIIFDHEIEGYPMHSFIKRIYTICEQNTRGSQFAKKLVFDSNGLLKPVNSTEDLGDVLCGVKYVEIKILFTSLKKYFRFTNLRDYQKFKYFVFCLVDDTKNDFPIRYYCIDKNNLFNYIIKKI
jgi:hypothetical protein